ncbi:hypothetical protein [Lentzea sp. E54]|uniref:hypothetical protein n=1 Tax=Lentzea xerophila TaxID=3435883 RepID=UPI003DA3B443
MRDYCDAAWAMLRARVELLRRAPDAGYVSEWVLVTALVISAAIVVVGVVVAKVAAKATGIEL